MEIVYSLEFIEDTLAGPTVVDELIADLVDNVFDHMDVHRASIRRRRHFCPMLSSDNFDSTNFVSFYSGKFG